MSAQTTRTRPKSFEEVGALSARMSSPEGVAKGLAFRPRPADVIITPYGKCGTTWIQQVFHGLRTRGDMDFDDISRVVPWIETAHELGLDLDAPRRADTKAICRMTWSPKGRATSCPLAIRRTRSFRRSVSWKAGGSKPAA